MSKPTPATHYTPDEYDTFAMAQKMRQLRLNNRMTLDELEKKLDYNRTLINRIELNKSKYIPKEVVDKMSVIFGVPVDKIVVHKNTNPAKDIELWRWITNEEESLPYLQNAFYQYLKDHNKIRY